MPTLLLYEPSDAATPVGAASPPLWPLTAGIGYRPKTPANAGNSTHALSRSLHRRIVVPPKVWEFFVTIRTTTRRAARRPMSDCRLFSRDFITGLLSGIRAQGFKQRRPSARATPASYLSTQS